MNGGTMTTTAGAMAAPALLKRLDGSDELSASPGSEVPAQNQDVQRAATAIPHTDPATIARAEPDPAPPAADPEGRMRPRQMTIELPAAPIEVVLDRKLSLEDHSPKPCIAPGNALHLIDDDPSPRSQTPTSVIVLAAEDTAEDGRAAAAESDRSASEPPPAARPAPRVRFRSRVRITSGVHRHRHGVGGPDGQPHAGSGTGTPSSGSESPSSSISAPLRYHADENAAWGPLGRRLSAYANATRPKRMLVVQGDGAGDDGHLGERAPLVRSARRARYAATDNEDSRLREEEEFEEELRAAALREQEDAFFGPWPQRLLNRHWWWWHLEPIICCTYCSEESDYEE
ncbi:hypothetical protein WOLCODRAFT_147196 [Wolfiporia cocos MD-104 SS10]|uniref:Uncharacterized protein n=1 Tax=Wolfiporia cocos (strain MD-104) TaxID=742152 RepID=A0A2H3IZX6_WOLCO|nr:hypothetical protein WOLCODRAFT_147196 [Wolfiporia cocos MD-104 SS10]